MERYTKCPQCGTEDLSWADKRFGHCKRRGPRPRIRDRTGYHPGLARFPGDRQAWVDSDRELNRVVSQRKRDGWVEHKYADMKTSPKAEISDDLFMETYDQVRTGELSDDGSVDE